jgi:hypothetical protein
MAYLKPPAFARVVFNRLAMVTGIGGSVTLAVPRRSGGTQSIPVIVVEYEASRFLVSTRGESVWVKNLRAAGEAALRIKGKTEAVTATEVAVAERPPILDAYKAKGGKVVETYFTQLPDPADHPVFLLTTKV